MIDITSLKPEHLLPVLKTGNLQSLPAEYQEYFNLLDFVRGLAATGMYHGKVKSKAGIIKILKTEKNLSDYEARLVYEDSINFFYSSPRIKTEAFSNMYADQLDEAAQIALHTNQLDAYKDLKKEAAKLRGCYDKKKVEIPQELYRKQYVIYTTDVEDVGGIPEDLKELERQLEALPEIPTIKLDRAKMEAGITKFNVIKMMAEDVDTFDDESNS
ncbi:MAG TPA: hypothetical protein VK152_00340 [Paludibacter sp.]|nr:hypothetical protein [Paludibacter sp.]